MNLLNIINQINEIGVVQFDVRKGGLDKLSVNEFNQVEEILINAGAEPTGDFIHLCGNEFYRNYKLDGHKFSVDFVKTQTTEEKIADLQNEIDRLYQLQLAEGKEE